MVSPSNVNCIDNQGRLSTPLHLAAGFNHLEIAELLLKSGADVNASDKGGLIPLHNAASFGHYDMTSLLISAGSDVNATDNFGFTVLHEAAKKGRTLICALLIDCGADPGIQNWQGKAPADLICPETSMDLSILLRDAMSWQKKSSSEERNCECGGSDGSVGSDTGSSNRKTPTISEIKINAAVESTSTKRSLKVSKSSSKKAAFEMRETVTTNATNTTKFGTNHQHLRDSSDSTTNQNKLRSNSDDTSGTLSLGDEAVSFKNGKMGKNRKIMTTVNVSQGRMVKSQYFDGFHR